MCYDKPLRKCQSGASGKTGGWLAEGIFLWHDLCIRIVLAQAEINRSAQHTLEKNSPLTGIRHALEGSMKVAFIGNTCNQAYANIKAFRPYGVEGTLYYDLAGHMQTFPESEDPEVAVNRPAWIKTFNSRKQNLWAPPPQGLLEELRGHDVIHCEGGYLPWAQATGKPYVWWACGGDAQHYPFVSGWLWLGLPLDAAFERTVLIRRAIASANQINLGQWLPVGLDFEHLLLTYNLKSKFQREILVIDTETFSPRADGPSVNELLARNGLAQTAEGLVIFNPTRIMFTPKSTYNYGSDILLRILYVVKKMNRKFTLIVTRKGNVDEPEFEKMIHALGLSENIIWIPPQKRADLIDWYRASDLVANDFGFGGIGSISIESMACGTPLLTVIKTAYDDPTFEIPDVATSYPPPFFSAHSEEEAIKNIVLCSSCPEAVKEKGRASRQWVMENCSAEAIAPRYRAMYQRAIDNFPISEQALLSLPVNEEEIRLRLLECEGPPQKLQLLVERLTQSPESGIIVEHLVGVLEEMGEAALARKLHSTAWKLRIDVHPDVAARYNS